MRATLSRSRALYDAETYADLDLYLAVPERLLRDESELPSHAEASALMRMMRSRRPQRYAWRPMR